MSYSGAERRKYPRISGRFIVSYRIYEKGHHHVDMSQTKNLSLGGMLLTTNKEFRPGTILALEIRLPFEHHLIMLIGKVLESHEITKHLIYDTRIQFIGIKEKHKGAIGKTVDYYLRKDNK